QEEVRLLPRTTVSGYYDHNFLVAVERITDHLPFADRKGPRQRVWKIRAKQVILATGAIERPLVFAENDRPGVMLADAAKTYVNRYGARPGSRAVVFTNNDSAYRAAMDAADGGIHVVAIVDLRAKLEGTLIRQARDHGIEVIANSAITAVKGAKQVSEVQIMTLSDDGTSVSGGRRSLDCDLVMMSGGWNPTVHLASQSGAKTVWDDALATFLPGVPKQAQRNAGGVAGRFGLAGCLLDGASAGAQAAFDAGFDAEVGTAPAIEVGEGDGELNLRPIWTVPSDRKGAKRFHDFQNDVTAADIALAHRENYASVEHFKRYTTTGMGTDQGKTSNVNGLAILAELRNEPVPSVGHTTFRPFYTAVTIGALAGNDTGPQLLDPVRKTAMHTWHEAHGAQFEDVGAWKRPYCYLRDGESVKQAVDREALATRTSVA
ncbi:MAG: FAD-dependent oxidoreductase, partial [Alphaproteobacteria bacterium]